MTSGLSMVGKWCDEWARRLGPDTEVFGILCLGFQILSCFHWGASKRFLSLWAHDQVCFLETILWWWKEEWREWGWDWRKGTRGEAITSYRLLTRPSTRGVRRKKGVNCRIQEVEWQDLGQRCGEFEEQGQWDGLIKAIRGQWPTQRVACHSEAPSPLPREVSSFTSLMIGNSYRSYCFFQFTKGRSCKNKQRTSESANQTLPPSVSMDN